MRTEKEIMHAACECLREALAVTYSDAKAMIIARIATERTRDPSGNGMPAAEAPEIMQARKAEIRDRMTLSPAQIEAEHRALVGPELALISAGKYVAAITAVKTRTGYDLSKSKQIVDGFRDLLRAGSGKGAR